MQDGGPKLDRLDRILAAMASKRTANKHDGSELIDQSQLAKRIEYIDVDFARRRCAARALRRAQTRRRDNFRNVGAAFGMPGRDDGQEIRISDFETTMSIDNDAFFAGMGGSRDHNGSSPGRVGQGGELAGVDRQGGDIEFEIAGYADARRTQRAEALRIFGGTHQAKGKLLQQRFYGLGKKAPTAVGALPHASVDENHRNLACGRPQHDIGPQDGFDKQDEARMP